MQQELTILLSYRDCKTLRDEILKMAPGARFLIPSEIDADKSLLDSIDVVYGKLDPTLFPKAARLQWIQLTSAGVDWTARPEVQSHPAIVTNARIHAEPISQHLFGMLLMLTRGLNIAYSNQREHNWDRSPYQQSVYELTGRTLCIVGLGVIGRRCAQLGEAFGMRVIGVRRHKRPVQHVEKVFGEKQLTQALSSSDIVMVIVPGTTRTQKLFGLEQFAAMPRGSFFFNAGRGATVDTDALTSALQEGRLRGAGLDVFDPEPLPSDHPLWDMPNVIITPHVAGVHPTYEKHAQDIFLENLRRFIAGEPLRDVIDKAEGY